MAEKLADAPESTAASRGTSGVDGATSTRTAPAPDRVRAALGLDTSQSDASRAATIAAAQGTIGAAQLNRLAGAPSVVRRACNCGGTCPACHARKMALREGDRAIGAAPATARTAVAQSAGGQALDPGVRRQMESAFGRDLGHVRVHRDANAANAASDLKARAFTVGDQVFFGSGRWAPETPDGRELLGHELAHVVQHGDGVGGMGPDRADELIVGSPSDPVEAEAQEAGRRVRRGDRVMSTSQSARGAHPALRADFVDDPWGTVVSTGQQVVRGAEALGHDLAQGVSTAVGDVQQGIGAAAQGATAGGTAISTALSGSHPRLVIPFPDIPLLDAKQTPLADLPAVVAHLPFLEAGAVLGPVILEADLGVEVAIRPQLIGVLGPASITNIHVVLDPLANTYTASGRLRMAASASMIVAIEPGLDLEAAAVIVAGEVPIPVEADAFGGLRLALRGTGLGTIDEAVTLGYRAGDVFLDATTDLKIGSILDAELDATLAVNVFTEPVCEYTWPLSSWVIASNAEQYTFPVSLTYGSAGPGYSFGPIRSKAIPVSEIRAVIPTLPKKRDCHSLDRLIDVLCKKGVLPPAVCNLPRHGGGAEFGGPAPGQAILTANVPSGLTPRDPIPITWFKPLAAYPDPISLTDWRGEVRDYKMTRPGQIVEPGRPIGVSRAYLPRYGKNVQLMKVIEDIDRGPGVDRFQALLDRHGFDRTGYDIDHVQDLAWDGYDDPDNLWPLDSSINQGAGRKFRSMRITYSNTKGGGPATPTTTDVPLNTAAMAPGRDNVIGRFFVIRDIRT
jgi:Domain of unknown function (DUF4157)